MKSILTLTFSVLLACTAFAGGKPNILWIVTDDQRADALECYNMATTGQAESKLGYVSSPAINKLAAQGVLFTKAFCNSPACAPSRGSMHRGQYIHHCGIYGFEQTHSEPAFTKPTIPETMRSAGYHTMKIGKSGYYIFQWKDGKIGYTEANFYNQMVDMKNNLQKHGHADFYKRVTWDKNGKIGDEQVWYYPNGKERSFFYSRPDGNITELDRSTKKSIYADQDVLTSYTRSNQDLILGGFSSQPTMKTLDGTITESLRMYLANPNKSYQALDGTTMEGPKTDEPQFFYVGYHFPHTPVLPSKSFRNKFADKSYKVPDFSKTELEKMPPQLVNWYNKMKVDEMTPREKQQMIRDYYAFCAMGDSLIGLAVESFVAYNKTQQQEYLIVLACGDHGWHLGEQGVSAKFGPFLQSNHTAVLVSASDKSKYPNGKICTDFVEYVDFAATFYAEAGIDIHSSAYDYLDGRDLAATVNHKLEPRAYVLGEMNHVYGPRAYMRSADFAFSMRTRKKNNKPDSKTPPLVDLKWALTTTAANAELALYDLRVDPLEQNNVAYDSDYIELAAWFRNKLGNIVLGDRRVECVWQEESNYAISDFALGADDKKLAIPNGLIPSVSYVKGTTQLPHIKVYPNPANHNFKAEATTPTDSQLMVFDAKGVVIERLQLHDSVEFGQNYAAGTYYVRVENQQGAAVVVKR